MNSQDSKLLFSLSGDSRYEPLPNNDIININEVEGDQGQAVRPEELSMEKKKEASIFRASVRHVQLTLNEVDNWDTLKSNILKMKNFHWGIATLEKAPSTGHKHIHFYVQFSKPSKLSAKLICGAHMEKCRGTVNENIAYIRKDHDPAKQGDIIYQTEGVEPWKDRVSKKAENGDKQDIPSIREVKEMSKDEREELPITLMKNVEEISRRQEAKRTGITVHKTVKVLYLYGKSGTGKSIYAKWLFRDHVFDSVKYSNGFWHGTGDGESECALYDDFRDSHMAPSEFINFIDYDIHQMNIKYGSYFNNYKFIIITSVQPPTQLWSMFQKNNEDKGLSESNIQWLRRMKCIDMEKYYSEHPDALNKYLKDLGLLEDEEEDENDPFKGIDFDI